MRKGDGSVQEIQSSSRTRPPGRRLTRSSSKRGDTATLASGIVSSQKTGKPILKMPGVKLKLNSKSNFKVSRTALLSNKLLLVGRRLSRYFPSIGNFYGTMKRHKMSKDTYTKKFSDGSWEILFSPTISQVSLRIVVALTSMKVFRSWDLERHRPVCQRRCRREKMCTWNKFEIFLFLKASS